MKQLTKIILIFGLISCETESPKQADIGQEDVWTPVLTMMPQQKPILVMTPKSIPLRYFGETFPPGVVQRCADAILVLQHA